VRDLQLQHHDGDFSSSTMMVMMMAMTPSENASRRDGPMICSLMRTVVAQ